MDKVSRVAASVTMILSLFLDIRYFVNKLSLIFFYLEAFPPHLNILKIKSLVEAAVKSARRL